ncbi:MAG: nitroreductase family protein [Candidatus Thermoplasmatota archaeon]|nr:nitroreductase family protein [Candidatus Thermoplasmatota archaeon]MBS3789755.1 nitroreductase family protein [Candidatus Thermoplasmatota archaeon]
MVDGDLLKVIKERRSIRDYKDEEISKESIKTLLESARWAPSGSNIQAWRIYVVKGDKLESIKKFSPGLLSDPPIIFVMCADIEEAENKGGKLSKDVLTKMDIAIAAQNICLQASSIGLGTCYIGSFNKKAIREILELPDHHVPELILTVGRPKKIPDPPKRKNLDELTRWVE